MKRDSAITAILCAIIMGLTAFSTQSKEGAMQGLMLCENVIIPSLLPMLIITNIIIKSSCAKIIEKIFGNVTKKLFGLPRCAATAIVLGMIGGYPTGAVLTHHLYEAGKISNKQAKQIMRFNFCGGIAFVITAVGTASLKSTRLGLVLYASSIGASLIIGIGQGIICKKSTDTNKDRNEYKAFTDAMIESVDKSMHSILNMCAYIILFSAIMSIVPMPQAISPLIEITNGVVGNGAKLTLPQYALYLAFGGECVHLQIIGYLNDMKIKYHDFLIHRVLSGAFAFGIARIYTHFYPEVEDVFSNIASSTAAFAQVNTGLSIVLLIGCVVIIFDVENKKSKLI